jgi:hypothetical protein
MNNNNSTNTPLYVIPTSPPLPSSFINNINNPLYLVCFVVLLFSAVVIIFKRLRTRDQNKTIKRTRDKNETIESMIEYLGPGYKSEKLMIDTFNSPVMLKLLINYLLY